MYADSNSLCTVFVEIQNVAAGSKYSPTGYIIQVKANRKWYICRRYSEIRAFWEKLLRLLADAKVTCPNRRHFMLGMELETFPGKKVMQSVVRSQKIIQERIQVLNMLLFKLCLRLRTCSEEGLRRCEAKRCPLTMHLRHFLGFPEDMRDSNDFCYSDTHEDRIANSSMDVSYVDCYRHSSLPNIILC